MPNNHATLIWDIAELLRGDYKQADYGKVILPFTVLRRLDSVLAPTKEKVLAQAEKRRAQGIINLDAVLPKAAGQKFFNASPLDFKRLLDDPSNLARNIHAYLEGFSTNVRRIFEEWKFMDQVEFLDKKDLLYLVVQRFSSVDLHPDTVSNIEMGLIFEELIRKFSELSNETAGEHFTPREVVQLAVNLLFHPDDAALSGAAVRSLYDPTAGTGGMLSVSDEHVTSMNSSASLKLFGQELNTESHAICQSDMLVKGQDPDNIVQGNTLSADGHKGKTFDYMLANPPFGVNWSKVKEVVNREHKEQGYAGRFGPGTPRVNDGSLLFLMHMLSKMKAKEGSRIGIVFNGSPLFTGDAGGNESEIRRWIIESDWLEAIIGLPTDLFYNTGISTYIWILTNRKAEERKGLIQLIDASDLWEKMPTSLGSKRKRLSQDHIDEITRLYGSIAETEKSKLVSNDHFGYRKVTVERPMRVAVYLTDERMKAFKEACEKKKDVALFTAVEAFRVERGDGPFLDFNAFVGWLEEAGERVTVARTKLLLGDLTEPDPEAAAVIKKAYSHKKREADPRYGLFPAEIDGKQKVVEYESDTALRDYEYIPLAEDVEAFFDREVRPYIGGAWINAGTTDHKDGQVGKVGYEINFTREFSVYDPPRSLGEIRQEIAAVQMDVSRLLGEISSAPGVHAEESDEDKRLRETGGARWPARRVRTIAHVRPSGVDKKTRDGEQEVQLCNYMDVYRNEYLSAEIGYMSASASDAQVADFSLRAGDVLATKDSESPDDIAVPAFVPESLDEVVCAYHLTQIRGGAEIDGEFLFRALQSHPVSHYFSDEAKGVTRYGLTIRAFSDAPIPLPAVSEQRAVTNHLRKETQKIDRLISLQKRLNDLLGEYRGALITAAVAGLYRVDERPEALESFE